MKQEECAGCIGFSDEHTCSGWEDLQRLHAERGKCRAHTRLRKAARKLMPYAESWKDTISWCEDGEEEIRAIEEFLDACREEL